MALSQVRPKAPETEGPETEGPETAAAPRGPFRAAGLTDITFRVYDGPGTRFSTKPAVRESSPISSPGSAG